MGKEKPLKEIFGAGDIGKWQVSSSMNWNLQQKRKERMSFFDVIEVSF